MTRDWKSLVDQLLDEAQQSGKFDNLPNNGQRLNLDSDPYTPSDMVLAHKILKENDLAPEWMLLGREVDSLRERLLENMCKGAQAYTGALADAGRSSSPFEKRQQAEITWNRALQTYQTAAEKLNREILRYNLKVPPGIPQKALFDTTREAENLLKAKG